MNRDYLPACCTGRALATTTPGVVAKVQHPLDPAKWHHDDSFSLLRH
jgi:hypothetical protein